MNSPLKDGKHINIWSLADKELMNNVTFTDETLKKNKLLIDKQELNDLLLGTKEMHSMNFDTDGVLRRRSKSGWKVIFDFICNKIIHVKGNTLL